MNKKLAWIPISQELLRQMLHLPEGTEFISAEVDWKFGHPAVRLLVTHPDINEVKDGSLIPDILPEFTTEYDSEGRILDTKMTDWRQNEK